MASLTVGQLATIKAFILADPILAAQPSDGDGLGFIADALNAVAVPDYLVWRTDAQVNDIFDAVDRSKYTPADAADNTATYTNRTLLAQTKLMALDGMLFGRTSLDASKANIRASLRDATIAVPSGVGGANTTPGGASGVLVLTACTRKATVLEKLLVTSTPTTGTVTAGVMGFQGTITPTQVDTARRS